MAQLSRGRVRPGCSWSLRHQELRLCARGRRGAGLHARRRAEGGGERRRRRGGEPEPGPTSARRSSAALPARGCPWPSPRPGPGTRCWGTRASSPDPPPGPGRPHRLRHPAAPRRIPGSQGQQRRQLQSRKVLARPMGGEAEVPAGRGGSRPRSWSPSHQGMEEEEEVEARGPEEAPLHPTPATQDSSLQRSLEEAPNLGI